MFAEDTPRLVPCQPLLVGPDSSMPVVEDIEIVSVAFVLVLAIDGETDC